MGIRTKGKRRFGVSVLLATKVLEIAKNGLNQSTCIAQGHDI
jgi:hypothetical protein